MQHPATDSDLALVTRIQSGDEGAFGELMDRYKRPLLNFLYRLLGNASEAEDLAQETFVRTYQNIGRFRPRTARFSTWLFQLARNAAIDRLRYRKRHPESSLETAPAAVASKPTAGRSPAEHAVLSEIGEQIAAAVADLPEDQRTALILAEYQDLSYAEIAAVMERSEKSVESRIYRAKQYLRERLGHLMS
jgi:RNA polymerase sigma-70 factor (ECF subfamily)